MAMVDWQVTVPAPVAASMALTEVELDTREKDHVAGVYNWVLLETKERLSIIAETESRRRQTQDETDATEAADGEGRRLDGSKAAAARAKANARIIAAPVKDMVDHQEILKMEAEHAAKLAAAGAHLTPTARN